jgi:hypothetical protein
MDITLNTCCYIVLETAMHLQLQSLSSGLQVGAQESATSVQFNSSLTAAALNRPHCDGVLRSDSLVSIQYRDERLHCDDYLFIGQ